ncbi:CRISPR-associated protein Cmr5 [Porphyromonas sp. COT-108 OH2963]|uniref:type III-B CRISPR module RAMP protein Cmr6 n=1 Tax=Porphyromonas sp. COT-108 OH2963 TaxID=1515614 RepID=UPI00052BE0CB|nr:type III-B CRISPR module RAMP protein Cmr6 [Porphyromonas sp. COT-108 OH2963]KGN96608.1 CRISPR-associated protein Cmr5 [Porphyromonas sp. COT-108 OH2963]
MNFGHWYYQEYFDTINLNSKGIVTNFSKFNKEKNDKLKNKLKGATLPYKEEVEGGMGFELTTCYPGLLCGVGYHHEINKPKNEPKEDNAPEVYNLGMYFDYTSGLPVIPGSSIKGALRSAIEEWDFLEYKEGDEQKVWSGWKKEEFIKEIFEGEGKSIYDRDIFLDAYPVSVSGDSSLFGDDYITHHENPLKDPNPVRFLRVNPGVTYRFRFLFRNNGSFTAEAKEKLFREIILTFGLGAKTNVGYGQFTDK